MTRGDRILNFLDHMALVGQRHGFVVSGGTLRDINADENLLGYVVADPDDDLEEMFVHYVIGRPSLPPRDNVVSFPGSIAASLPSGPDILTERQE